jgi:hypothetical protein
VPIGAATVVNGVQTVVDSDAALAYWTAYRYRLLATKNGVTAPTDITYGVINADPFSKTVGLTLTPTASADTVYSIKVVGTRTNADSIYEGLTVTLYRAKVDTANVRIGEWTPAASGLTFTRAISTDTPKFEYTDSGLDGNTKYTYRADVYAGSTLLKNTTTYAGLVEYLYPSTAYSILSTTTASLNTSTDQTAATLQLALSSPSNANSVITGAKLYTFAVDGTPRTLGTIEYRNDSTSVTTTATVAPITAYSYYVRLDATGLRTLRELGSNTYVLVTENGTTGVLQASSASISNIDTTLTTPPTILTSLAGAAAVRSGDDHTEALVTFSNTTTENTLLPNTMIYYWDGTAYQELGRVAPRAAAAVTGDATHAALSLNQYYVRVDNTLWQKLRLIGSTQLGIRSLATVPSGTGAYTPLGTVNF